MAHTAEPACPHAGIRAGDGPALLFGPGTELQPYQLGAQRYMNLGDDPLSQVGNSTFTRFT